MRTILAILFITFASHEVLANTSNNKVNEFFDWAVFEEKNPAACWAVSRAKTSKATFNGKLTVVKRADILLFVQFRPGSNNVVSVAFTPGFPLKAQKSLQNIAKSDLLFLVNGRGHWKSKI